ncbi:MAG: histidine phosphatase family protein [Ktedonobacteraceae bacterium]|jgi:broad specificity phosphatase PhoE
MEINISTGEGTSENSHGVQRFWLVRHGLTQWNAQHRYCGHSDIPLVAAGRVQARWLASQLRPVLLRGIYSSNLIRALETAEIIASKQVSPLEVNASAAWREIAFGSWEGLTYSEIAATFTDRLEFFTDPAHYTPPGGESLTDVLGRMRPALTEIMQRFPYEQGDIVIVSHGGALRALLCALLNMSLSQQWQLRLDPGSLSAVDLSLDEHGSFVATLVLMNSQRSSMRNATSLPTAYGARVSKISAALPGYQEAGSKRDG